MRDAFGHVSRWVAVRVIDTRGATLVEYTLLLSLIVLVALAGVTAFGEGVNDSFDDSTSRIVTAGSGYP